MSTPPTRVALVDDHTLVRDGLVGIVNSLPGYEVVLTAEDGLAFTKALERGPEVDIAIVDLSMPIMDGYATIRWLHDHRPAIRSVALTFDDRESAAIRAIRNGACGFLLKNMSLVEFKEALDQVRDHGRFDGHLAAQDRPLRTAYERAQAKVHAAITEREFDFISLACAREEYTYEEIAERLGVKLSTLETHRKNLFERFGIKSRSGLVIFAYRWGIVQVVME
ncbi:MAG: response regulator transcription factor [Flavobacteriales bacterium]